MKWPTFHCRCCPAAKAETEAVKAENLRLWEFIGTLRSVTVEHPQPVVVNAPPPIPAPPRPAEPTAFRRQTARNVVLRDVTVKENRG